MDGDIVEREKAGGIGGLVRGEGGERLEIKGDGERWRKARSEER